MMDSMPFSPKKNIEENQRAIATMRRRQQLSGRSSQQPSFSSPSLSIPQQQYPNSPSGESEFGYVRPRNPAAQPSISESNGPSPSSYHHQNARLASSQSYDSSTFAGHNSSRQESHQLPQDIEAMDFAGEDAEPIPLDRATSGMHLRRSSFMVEMANVFLSDLEEDESSTSSNSDDSDYKPSAI